MLPISEQRDVKHSKGCSEVARSKKKPLIGLGFSKEVRLNFCSGLENIQKENSDLRFGKAIGRGHLIGK